MAFVTKILCALSFFLFISVLIPLTLHAQNEVAIGSATTKSNAILWLNGNGSQGLILPVVSNKSAVSNPDKGMVVFDESDNKVWYRNNTIWIEVGTGGGSSADLNLQVQGNALQLRDGTDVLSTTNIASGTQTAGGFMVFQGGSWQFATLSGDVTGANGALQVGGIRGKTIATLPASVQALVYDPAANSGAGGFVFQSLSAGGGITSVSGTAPVTISGPALTPTISLSTAGITNALLADNAVTSTKIQDGTITGVDIAASTITGANIGLTTITGNNLANTTITADKLAASGASNGQVLKWNGTNWVPAADDAGSGGVPILSTGQILIGDGSANSPAIVSGDATLSGGTLTISDGAVTTAKLTPGAVIESILADNAVTTNKLSDNAVTTAKITANAVNASKLADGAVTSAKILDGTITGPDISNTTITADKLAASGANLGQVLKWNGTNWVPAADDAGSGALPVLGTNQLVSNDGTTNVAVSLSGDASFSFPGVLNLTDGAVTTQKITDNAVNSAKITDGTITAVDIANTSITSDKIAQSSANTNDVLQWNGTNWVPATLAGGGTVTQINTGTGLTGGPISNTGTISIAAGGVGTTELANNSVDATKLADNAVTNIKVADNAITSAKIENATITGADIANTTITGTNIVNTSITADKLAASGANNGQVLKFDGTNWVPAADDAGSGSLPTLTTGQLVTNDGTSNIAVAMNGDATFTSTGALTIANNAITSAKIVDGTIADVDIANVAPAKITQAAATPGQVLKWNGTSWAPADDAGEVYTPGAGIQITANSIINTGDIDASDDITITSIAGGDLSGTFSNLQLTTGSVTTAEIADGTITGADIANTTITGTNIANTSITADKFAASGANNGQVLKFDGANWVPANDDAGAGAVPTLTNGQILIGDGVTNAAAALNGDATLTGSTITIADGAISGGVGGKIADGTITDDDINTISVAKITGLVDNDATNEIQNLSQVLIIGNNAGAEAITNLANPTNAQDAATKNYVDTQLATVTDDQTAAEVPVTPTGNLTATNTQDALVELQTDIDNIPALPTTTDAQIIVSNGTTPTAVTMTGDVTITNTGLTTIANDAVTSAKIADGEIATADIAPNAVTTDKIADGTITDVDVAAAAAIAGTKVSPDFGAQNITTTGTLNTGGLSTTSTNVFGALAGAGNRVLITANDGTLDAVNNAAGVLTNDGVGGLTWSTASSGWGLEGNAGIDPALNFVGTTDAQPLRFATGVGGVERMRISETGNVGIGTSVPGSKLEVSDNATNSITAEIKNENSGATVASTGTVGLRVSTSDNAAVQRTGIDVWVNGSGASNTNGIQVLAYSSSTGINRGVYAFARNSSSSNYGVHSFADGNFGTNYGVFSQVSGSGTQNKYGFYTNAQGEGNKFGYYAMLQGSGNKYGIVIEGENINYFSGSVGIGTITPNAPLQFASSLANRKIVLFEGANNDHEFFGFGINSAELRYQTDKNSSHVFYSGVNSTSSTELMRIQSDGNVGIGTVTPTAKLDILGNIKITDGTQAAGSVLTSDANGVASWQLAGGSGWGLTGNALADATSFLGTTTAQPLRFSTGVGGVERMRIDETGRVGIGTLTPTAALDVIGNGLTGINVTTNDPNGYAISAINTSIGDVAGFFHAINPAGGVNNHGVYGQADGAGAGVFGGNNGTTGVAARFWNFNVGNANPVVQIFNAGTGPALTTEIGNVGIGTATPAERLHIGAILNQDTYIQVEAGGTASNYSGIMLTEASLTHGMAVRHSADTDALYISNTDNNSPVNFVDLVTVTRGGDMGIGTIAPTAKLEVAGQVKITGGAPAAGKVLTSGPDGLATWEDASGAGWSLGGNAGTLDGIPGTGTNYIGTSDNVQLNFMVNNQRAGRVDHLAFNSFFGYQAGNNTTGANNVAMGHIALQSNTTGNFNTAIGSNAMATSSTGSFNAAVGADALRFNTTGAGNATFGAFSLRANTSGQNNSAFGSNTMISNTTGYNNAAFGTQALQVNSTGNDNTATGFYALNQNLGSFNTALGSYALFYNAGGSNATAIGYGAMERANDTATPFNNTNVALGYQALRGGSATPSNNTGLDNTAIGYRSMADITTGGFNTAVGVEALLGVTTGEYNTAVGYRALRNFNSAGANGGNVAVGDYSLYATATTNLNTAIGKYSGVNNSGSQNVFVGSLSGNVNTTGGDNTFVGYGADASTGNLSNATAIGSGAVVSTNNTIQLGNSSVTSVTTNGEINRPSTGTANLVPIAYGVVSSTGAVISGTGNYISEQTGDGEYSITVNGETLVAGEYIVIANGRQIITGSPVTAMGLNTSSQPYVVTFRNGLQGDYEFQFIIYKL